MYSRKTEKMQKPLKPSVQKYVQNFSAIMCNLLDFVMGFFQWLEIGLNIDLSGGGKQKAFRQ